LRDALGLWGVCLTDHCVPVHWSGFICWTTEYKIHVDTITPLWPVFLMVFQCNQSKCSASF